MKRISVLGISMLLLAGGVWGKPTAVEAPDVWQADLVVRNGEAVTTSTLIWRFQRGRVDQFRLETQEGKRQHTLLYDGHTIYEFYNDGTPAMPLGSDLSNIAIKTPWVSFETIFEDQVEGEDAGEERVEGQSCDIRKIVWTTTDEYSPVKEWVWKGTDLILKRESEVQGQRIAMALQGAVKMTTASLSHFALPKTMSVFTPIPAGTRTGVVGQPFVDATLRVAGGATRKGLLSTVKGKKALVVNFFATWCGPCHRETPLVVNAYEQYGPQDVAFLSLNVMERVNADDRDALVADFVKQYGLKWPVFIDDGLLFTTRRYAWGIPTCLVIDARGIIRGYWVDGGEEGLKEWLDHTLGDLLPPGALVPASLPTEKIKAVP